MAALVGLVAVWVAALLVTNPGARSSPGWERLDDMPAPRGEVASAITGTDLVVMGGLQGLGRTASTVSRYDLEGRRWSSGPDLPEARHHAAAAALGGDVYLSGGATGSATNWTAHRNLWVLENDSREWDGMPDMPEGRYGHQLLAIDRRLYVVGGEGGTGNVLIHDPSSGWTTGAALPQPRDHLAAVVVDREIWAMGGRADEVLARVDIYDPENDAWRRGPDLPVPMSAMTAGVLDGTIHVVGGERPGPFRGEVIDRHYRLTPRTSRWEEQPRPILAVHGAGGGAAGDQLIVVGGARREGALSVLAWTGVTQVYDPRRSPTR